MTYPVRQRIFVPACKPCNNAMGRVLEKPVENLVKGLLATDWTGPLDHDEWELLGRWLTKVTLLLTHREVRFSDDRLTRMTSEVRPDDGTVPDLHWLAEGTAALPSLSTVVFRADVDDDEVLHRLSIPVGVNVPDGTQRESYYADHARPGLHVAVFSHPGMTLRHPLVERGQAWELLHHAPPSGADLGSLPVLPRRAVTVIRGGDVPEGHQIDGSEASRLTGLFGYDDPNLFQSPGGGG